MEVGLSVVSSPDQVRVVEDEYPAAKVLASLRIWSMIKDHLGNIWIGTFDSGLYCLDPVTGTMVNFSPSLQDKNSICDLNIHALFEDSHEMLWVGTDNDIIQYSIDTVSGDLTIEIVKFADKK